MQPSTATFSRDNNNSPIIQGIVFCGGGGAGQDNGYGAGGGAASTIIGVLNYEKYRSFDITIGEGGYNSDGGSTTLKGIKRSDNTHPTLCIASGGKITPYGDGYGGLRGVKSISDTDSFIGIWDDYGVDESTVLKQGRGGSGVSGSSYNGRSCSSLSYDIFDNYYFSTGYHNGGTGLNNHGGGGASALGNGGAYSTTFPGPGAGGFGTTDGDATITMGGRGGYMFFTS